MINNYVMQFHFILKQWRIAVQLLRQHGAECVLLRAARSATSRSSARAQQIQVRAQGQHRRRRRRP